MNSEGLYVVLEQNYQFYAKGYTFNSNAKARAIDYLLYNAALYPQAYPLPTVDDHTALPGPEQPSDHVAVLAGLEWVE